MPKSRAMADFCSNNNNDDDDTTDCFIPCACVRGNNVY